MKKKKSDLHQPTRGFPRYRHGRLDSSYKKETTLKAKKLFCTHNVHVDAGLIRVERCSRCTRCMNLCLMSALHQPPRGFPRYHHGRLDSSYEKETTIKANKLFYTHNANIDAGLIRVERCSRCTRCMKKKIDERYLSNTPRVFEVQSWKSWWWLEVEDKSEEK